MIVDDHLPHLPTAVTISRISLRSKRMHVLGRPRRIYPTRTPAVQDKSAYSLPCFLIQHLCLQISCSIFRAEYHFPVF